MRPPKVGLRQAMLNAVLALEELRAAIEYTGPTEMEHGVQDECLRAEAAIAKRLAIKLDFSGAALCRCAQEGDPMIKKSQLSAFQGRLTLRKARRLLEEHGSVADLMALRHVESAVASLVPRSAPRRKRRFPVIFDRIEPSSRQRRRKR